MAQSYCAVVQLYGGTKNMLIEKQCVAFFFTKFKFEVSSFKIVLADDSLASNKKKESVFYKIANL